jgi:hypothetical protein
MVECNRLPADAEEDVVVVTAKAVAVDMGDVAEAAAATVDGGEDIAIIMDITADITMDITMDILARRPERRLSPF